MWFPNFEKNHIDGLRINRHCAAAILGTSPMAATFRDPSIPGVRAPFLQYFRREDRYKSTPGATNQSESAILCREPQPSKPSLGSCALLISAVPPLKQHLQYLMKSTATDGPLPARLWPKRRSLLLRWR